MLFFSYLFKYLTTLEIFRHQEEHPTLYNSIMICFQARHFKKQNMGNNWRWPVLDVNTLFFKVICFLKLLFRESGYKNSSIMNFPVIKILSQKLFQGTSSELCYNQKTALDSSKIIYFGSFSLLKVLPRLGFNFDFNIINSIVQWVQNNEFYNGDVKIIHSSRKHTINHFLRKKIPHLERRSNTVLLLFQGS